MQVAKRIGMVASRCCWVADGGAVLKVSMVVRCYWGMAFQVSMVARCY